LVIEIEDFVLKDKKGGEGICPPFD